MKEAVTFYLTCDETYLGQDHYSPRPVPLPRAFYDRLLNLGNSGNAFSLSPCHSFLRVDGPGGKEDLSAMRLQCHTNHPALEPIIREIAGLGWWPTRYYEETHLDRADAPKWLYQVHFERSYSKAELCKFEYLRVMGKGSDVIAVMNTDDLRSRLGSKMDLCRVTYAKECSKRRFGIVGHNYFAMRDEVKEALESAGFNDLKFEEVEWDFPEKVNYRLWYLWPQAIFPPSLTLKDNRSHPQDGIIFGRCELRFDHQ